MTKVCISFAGASGLLGFPEFPATAAQQLQAEFPHTTIVLARTPDERRAHLPDTDVLYSVRFSPEDLKLAKQLRWLQLSSAGATHILFPEMIESSVIVTNSRGLHAVSIAEHTLGMMLMLARKLHEAYRYQLEGKWARKEMFNRYAAFSELHSQTAGIVGLGSIGLAVAERVKALGMRVIATKRTGGVKPQCVDELLGTDKYHLHSLLRTADFVVIAAPLTPETHGLIGEPELRIMKPTAYIFNVGRGAIIQEAVLIRALKEEWIAGAGLDVTEVEPLPAESELLRLPNVLVTPHYSGLRSHYWEHALAIFKPNLQRFLRGEPLNNLVDKRAGY